MKNFTRREKWLVAIIGFFGAIVAGLMIGRFPVADAKLGDWGSLVSAIAAVFAIPLAVMGFLESTRTNRREHQPYLRIEISGRLLHWQVGQAQMPIEVTVTVENYGRTPAFDLTGRILAVAVLEPDVGDDGAGPSRFFDFDPFVMPDLPANAPRGVTRRPIDAKAPEEALLPAEYAQLRTRKRALYIQAQITFGSVFPDMKPQTVTRKVKFHGFESVNTYAFRIDDSVTDFDLWEYY